MNTAETKTISRNDLEVGDTFQTDVFGETCTWVVEKTGPKATTIYCAGYKREVVFCDEITVLA